MQSAPKAPYLEGVRDFTCPGAGPVPRVGSCGWRGSGIGLARRFGGCVSLQFWVGMCTVGGEDGVGVSAPTGQWADLWCVGVVGARLLERACVL